MKVAKRIKQWRYPEASERQLSRSLSGMAEDFGKRAKESVARMKFDATDDEINSEEDDLSKYLLTLLMLIIASLRPMSVMIYIFNSNQWIEVAKNNGGGDVPAVKLLETLGPNQTEAWFYQKRLQWESLSSASVKKLGDAILADWSTTVRDMNLKGKTDDQLKEAIARRADVWISWSKNRARNIVGTFNSILMMERLKESGVTSFIWRGMLDERERLQHLKWEGKVISLLSDHVFPGEPYGCRCWAQPYFNKEQINDS
ncbi:putative head-related protein [Erwinia phage Snitter]|nr:putative head-related protein [Erwinia phage Snitter]